jgi:hypothetical protein
MKKVIVLLALVVVGALVFATDAPAPTYDFAASTTTKWQYDLDTQKSGFSNDWDISLKYHLLNDVALSKKGEEGTYAQIDVTHLNLNLLEEKEDGAGVQAIGNDQAGWGDGAGDGTGDNLSVTAKIVSGALSVILYGAPSGDYDNAVYVPLFDKNNGYDNGSVLEAKVAPGGGLKVAYDLGDLGSISVGFGSYLKGMNNELADMDFGIDATIKPVKDVLSITAGLWYGAGQAKNDHGVISGQDLAATAKVALTAGDLSANAAIDLLNGDDLYFDASADVTYKLFEGKDSVVFDAYYTDITDPAAAEPFYKSHLGDFGFKFVDAEGLVPGLGFTVGVFADDVLADPANDPMLLSYAVSASYKVALSDATYVKPYGEYWADMGDNAAAFMGEALNEFKIGLEAVLFPNCTFDTNFQYNAQKNNDLNHWLATSGHSIFTVSAKISL